MLFEQILLKVIDRLNGERTISAPFHLLRGKKSGQTILDVQSYGLTETFSLFPRLPKSTYDKVVNSMVENQWVTINEQSIPTLTEAGMTVKNQLPSLSLNGWLYRGNEMIFFNRLSLLTQTLSHVAAGNMSFVPVQKDEKVQRWVRTFLSQKPYASKSFRNQFILEVEKCLLAATKLDVHRELITYRLSGYGITGFTWQQLAADINQQPMDVQIRFVEGLHLVLNELFSQTSYPILSQLTRDVRSLNPLTESASKTADLYHKGFSFNKISEIRHLKTSTIEDHFVEMAMNDPSFDISSFFGNEDMDSVIQSIKNNSSNKLRTLKEYFPDYSYFQLRLLLAVRGDVNANRLT
ncbi:MAG: helix-turn-helix domain-containing protein [Paenisporosarcina sp.]